jgi:hypothetical protein
MALSSSSRCSGGDLALHYGFVDERVQIHVSASVFW